MTVYNQMKELSLKEMAILLGSLADTICNNCDKPACYHHRDSTPYGGIDHPGETVREFLESTGYFPQSFEELNEILNECGIKPVGI